MTDKNSNGGLSRTVAARIKNLLRMSGRTQAALASVVGCDPATITRRMKGDHPWTVDELEAVASWLDVPIRDATKAATPKGDRFPPNMVGQHGD